MIHTPDSRPSLHYGQVGQALFARLELATA